MADRGWVRNLERGGWVLLDGDGEPVPGGALADGTPGQAAAVVCAAYGFPPVPAVPDLVCVLSGGAQDGRRVYLPVAGPPESLSFARPMVVAGRREPPTEWDRYVAVGQPCGHGRDCPFEYRWAGTVAAGGSA